MYGFATSTPQITIVACDLCQAPTKTNRLFVLPNQNEVCRDCAHINDHIPNNKVSSHCKHCEGGSN